MLRATWFGILVAMAPLAACSKDGETPAAAAHAAVGKVAVISGKVEAIRGEQTRVLAMGGEIFADDEVVVGADGSVGIDLAHNNARWSLEAGRRGKVRDSVAWTMAKVDAPAKPVEHATSAAGREGERNAATTATTEDRARSEEPAAAVAPAPGGPPAPVTAAPVEPKRSPVPPPKPSVVNEVGTVRGGGAGAGQGYGAGTGRLGSDRKSRASGSTKEAPASPMAPPPPPPPPPAPEDDATDKQQDAIRKVIVAQKATLQQCPGAAGLKVTITVARSVAKIAIAGGKPADPAATQKCMETKLQQLKLARAEPFSVTLDL